jgi:hypothetical protein
MNESKSIKQVTQVEAHRHEACRLCSGPTQPAFRAKVLGKHEVAYHECSECDSLQTDAPFWLAEAYTSNHLSCFDTGAVARNLFCQAYVYTIAGALRFSPTATVLDFGGGNGLLCRLLRDIGFNARRLDTFAVNDFCQLFDDDGGDYDIVCAFEVVEHFADPAKSLADIFGRAKKLIIIGTEVYAKQGRGWWYLNPAAGQHVFFYSPGAMKYIAKRFCFQYYPIGGLHLFSKRPLTNTEGLILNCALSKAAQKWVRAYLGYRLSFDSAARDSGLFPT